jgi:hypothetical protein
MSNNVSVARADIIRITSELSASQVRVEQARIDQVASQQRLVDVNARFQAARASGNVEQLTETSRELQAAATDLQALVDR